MKFEFRKLTADEIECRIAQISKQGKGLSLLLYKNARCDMNILDETVGPDFWQRKHKELKGNIYCAIGIWNDELDQWIWKWDCGAESYTEKEKGEASDSFKRAGFNWGIGRELYTAPFIWINAEDCKIENGKCYDKFKVSRIEINDNKVITKLEIKNKNKVVFSMGYDKVQYAKQAPVIEKEEKVICPQCGIQILNTPVKSGKVLSPQEVMAKWGKCDRCFKEDLKIKKQLEDLKNERP